MFGKFEYAELASRVRVRFTVCNTPASVFGYPTSYGSLDIVICSVDLVSSWKFGVCPLGCEDAGFLLFPGYTRLFVVDLLRMCM